MKRKSSIRLLPVGLPPDPAGVLCDEIARRFAQFAHDTGRKKTYDIMAAHAAVGIMRLFQEFLDQHGPVTEDTK